MQKYEYYINNADEISSIPSEISNIPIIKSFLNNIFNRIMYYLMSSINPDYSDTSNDPLNIDLKKTRDELLGLNSLYYSSTGSLDFILDEFKSKFSRINLEYNNTINGIYKKIIIEFKLKIRSIIIEKISPGLEYLRNMPSEDKDEFINWANANIDLLNLSYIDGEDSPLIILTEKGYFELVKILVEKYKVYLDYQDKNGKTSLMYAYFEKRKNILEYLLKNKANTNIKDETGNTILSYCFMLSDKSDDTDELLLEKGGTDPNMKINGMPYLAYILILGNYSKVNLLLKYGANPNIESDSGDSAIDISVKKKILPIIELFTKYPFSNINKLDKKGDTYIISAVKSGTEDDLKIIEILLKKGAILNIRNENRESPLILAVQKNLLPFVQLFIKYSANLNITDSTGNTALITAVKYGLNEIVNILINSGADPNIRNDIGISAIEQAIINLANNVTKDYTIVNSLAELLRKKKGIDIKNNYGDTALITAVKYGLNEIVNILINSGADPNIRNNIGISAIEQSIINLANNITKDYTIVNSLVNSKKFEITILNNPEIYKNIKHLIRPDNINLVAENSPTLLSIIFEIDESFGANIFTPKYLADIRRGKVSPLIKECLDRANESVKKREDAIIYEKTNEELEAERKKEKKEKKRQEKEIRRQEEEQRKRKEEDEIRRREEDERISKREEERKLQEEDEIRSREDAEKRRQKEGELEKKREEERIRLEELQEKSREGDIIRSIANIKSLKQEYNNNLSIIKQLTNEIIDHINNIINGKRNMLEKINTACNIDSIRGISSENVDKIIEIVNGLSSINKFSELVKPFNNEMTTLNEKVKLLKTKRQENNNIVQEFDRSFFYLNEDGTNGKKCNVDDDNYCGRLQLQIDTSSKIKIHGIFPSQKTPKITGTTIGYFPFYNDLVYDKILNKNFISFFPSTKGKTPFDYYNASIDRHFIYSNQDRNTFINNTIFLADAIMIELKNCGTLDSCLNTITNLDVVWGYEHIFNPPGKESYYIYFKVCFNTRINMWQLCMNDYEGPEDDYTSIDSGYVKQKRKSVRRKSRSQRRVIKKSRSSRRVVKKSRSGRRVIKKSRSKRRFVKKSRSGRRVIKKSRSKRLFVKKSRSGRRVAKRSRY